MIHLLGAFGRNTDSKGRITLHRRLHISRFHLNIKEARSAKGMHFDFHKHPYTSEFSTANVSFGPLLPISYLNIFRYLLLTLPYDLLCLFRIFKKTKTIKKLFKNLSTKYLTNIVQVTYNEGPQNIPILSFCLPYIMINFKTLMICELSKEIILKSQIYAVFKICLSSYPVGW